MLGSDQPLGTIAVWPVSRYDGGRRGSQNEPDAIITRPALTAHLVGDEQRGVCDSACDSPDQLDLEYDRPNTALLSDERYVIDICMASE